MGALNGSYSRYDSRIDAKDDKNAPGSRKSETIDSPLVSVTWLLSSSKAVSVMAIRSLSGKAGARSGMGTPPGGRERRTAPMVTTCGLRVRNTCKHGKENTGMGKGKVLLMVQKGDGSGGCVIS